MVIGGTSFIGRATVSALLDAGICVTLVNRGQTQLPAPFYGRVDIVCCDRQRRPEILQATLERPSGWDAVIDFVAFEPADITSVVAAAAAGARIGRYVFISTDSVYMACNPEQFQRDSDGRLIEASADGGCCEQRARDDEYGAGKLATEQALASSSLNWCALRLPDVLGPHENTGRMEKLLLRLCKGRRIGTGIDGANDAAGSLPLSLVFAEDVAAAVCAVIWSAEGATSATPTQLPRALHICSTEAPTWPDLVKSIADELLANGIDVPPVRFDASRDTGLVSVDCGALSNGAALGALQGRWQPQPLQTRIVESVRWWVDQMRAGYAAAQLDAGPTAPLENHSDQPGSATVATEMDPAEAAEVLLSRRRSERERAVAKRIRVADGTDCETPGFAFGDSI